MTSASLTLTARWVVPVVGPPLDRGVVTISDERILAVGPRGEQTADLDLGNAALLPGLVNAHTHLDLSGARGLVPPTPDFTAWLRGVIAYRRSRTPEQVHQDIRVGLAESLRHGTTLLGDVSADGSSWAALSAGPMRSLVYRELIGLSEDRLEQTKSLLVDWKEHQATRTCRPGVSPHAPYSVHTSLIDVASKSSLPFCIHLAETAEELELLAGHSGPFVEFLRELGAWNPSGLSASIESILARTRRAKNPVYVHCNYLSADTPSLSAGTVVYCPRTHAAFGHPPHPFREFLARGIRVALGTDSLASNPDLDLLAEARFIHQRYPEFDPRLLLRMATLSGAEALGWRDETGSLAPGKSADLVVAPLADVDSPDPHALVFESSLPVDGVMVRGQWLHPPRSQTGRGG
jgi:aminodeoxyfutalosine deaminase